MATTNIDKGLFKGDLSDSKELGRRLDLLVQQLHESFGAIAGVSGATGTLHVVGPSGESIRVEVTDGVVSKIQ